MQRTFVILLTLAVTILASDKWVAFRLDDIQSYYLEKQQKAVIDVFKDYNVPLTVGVIANYFTGSTMINYIRECVEDEEWDFDVVEHGFNHESFKQLNLTTQQKLMTDAVPLILNAINSPKLTQIKTFIPPFNDINSDTFTALKAAGYKTLCAAGFNDHPPYPYDNSVELYRFPMAASTTDQTVTDFSIVPVTPEYTFNQIQTQFTTSGFSVVMMHPQEFAEFSGGVMQHDKVNATMVSELRRLLKMVYDSGMKFTVVSKMHLALQGKYTPPVYGVDDDGDSLTTTTSAASTGTTTTTTTTTGPATTRPMTTSPASTGMRPLTTNSALTSADASDGGSPGQSTTEDMTSGSVLTTNQMTTGQQMTTGTIINEENSTTSLTLSIFVTLCTLFFVI